jgi:predicted RNA binding protein YcfA (HicA-like mRNA interferase family)
MLKSVTMPNVKKVRDAIKRVERDGWYLIRQRGSHRQFKHPQKPGLVTISGHRLSDDIDPEMWKSIMRQAQIADEED